MNAEVAGFGRRVAAALIDTAATVAVLLLGWIAAGWTIGLVSGFAGLSDRTMDLALTPAIAAVAIVAPWLYWAGLEAWTPGGTIGKALLKIRVRNREGRRPGFGRASGRFWLKALLVGALTPIGLIAFFVAAADRRHRTLWDLAAGTLVLVREPEPAEEREPAQLALSDFGAAQDGRRDAELAGGRRR